METNKDLDKAFEKRQRALKRIEEIKGFYSHLTVYIVINLVILIWSAMQLHDKGEPAFQWPMLITPAAWGIGLAFHYARTFGLNPFFGKEWEARQIRKYMEQDEAEARKFK